MPGENYEQLTLYPSRWASVPLALVCLPLTVVFVVLFARHPSFAPAVGILLFGLGTFAAIRQLLRPREGAIVLSAAGYSTPAYLRHGVVVPWTEIERFYVGSLPTYRTRSKAVLYRVSDDYLARYPKTRGVLKLIGSDPMVPSFVAYKPSQHSLKRKQLAALLERWRRHYGAVSTSPSQSASADKR